MIKIGKNIKKLREKKSITQEKLANYLGVTPQAISRWESETGYPDIELLPLIADFFDVTIDELLDRNISQNKNEIKEGIKDIGRLHSLNDKLREVKELSQGAASKIRQPRILASKVIFPSTLQHCSQFIHNRTPSPTVATPS